ncbi:pyridoxamine 5'-phosphate oxidase family protein [Agathobacter sp.]
MFRPMRRKSKETDKETAKQLLRTERRGVFAVNGDDGYPYAVPVNFYYDESADKIYFHGAGAGHKFDALQNNDKVCFTVYGNETIKENEAWAPYVQSVVVFGRCRVLDDMERTIELTRKVAQKYYPDEAAIDEEIAKAGKAVRVYEITIEHISGKQIQEK